MTDKRDDGGPAFPQYSTDPWGKHLVTGGATLRDWFAGQALMGMVADSKGLAITVDQFASQSYKLADAMLAERSKP